MRRTLLLWLAASLALEGAARAADPVETGHGEVQWMTVLLDGRKIGHARSERRLEADRVVTSQHMQLTLERNGTRISMLSEETSIESIAGEPLGIRGEVALGAESRRYVGEIADGVLRVTLDGDPATPIEVPWPPGALLADGQRRALAEAPHEGWIEMTVFLPDAMQAGTLSLRRGDIERIDLPDAGPTSLQRIEQTLTVGGSSLPSESWVDDRQRVLRMRMPVFGTFIEMLACSRACAQAPVQSSEVFERTLARAPADMQRSRLDRALRYRIGVRDGQDLELVASAEQRVSADGDTWLVEVHPGVSRSDDAPPDASLLAANRWIESDAEAVREMAQRAAGDGNDAHVVMRRLEAATRSHISRKSLRVGYASALETLHSGEGDCTEHALLLAALGRARGIPTRIATGLVYADRFGEARQVFVPHAWTQAWIDGRWVSFDAAQDGFGSGHILLGSGDGEPWRFYQGVSQLGRIDILAVERVR